MNGKIDLLSVVSGIVMIFLGLGMVVASFWIPAIIFYGLGILVLGIVILYTLKEQEKIEPIKEKKRKKKNVS